MLHSTGTDSGLRANGGLIPEDDNMSHGIMELDTIAWWKKMPWHHLGTEIPELLGAEEMIKAAGLDWNVEKWPMAMTEPFGADRAAAAAIVRGERTPIIQKVDDFVATVRRVEGGVVQLGVVGSGYKPIQNSEAFNFLDGLGDQVKFDVAGSIYNGQRICALGRVGDFRIPGTDDQNIEYLLLCNDHAGKMALRCFFTTVRVVCANTMTLALNQGKGEGITIRHNGDVRVKMAQAQKVLIASRDVFTDWTAKAEALAKKQLTDRVMQDVWKALIPDPAPKIEDGKEVAVSTSRAQGVRSELTRLFDEGTGNDMSGVKGSAWAALNAVTEFIDHGRNVNGDQNSRVASAWFGQGASMKQEAARLLLAA